MYVVTQHLQSSVSGPPSLALLYNVHLLLTYHISLSKFRQVEPLFNVSSILQKNEPVPGYCPAPAADTFQPNPHITNIEIIELCSLCTIWKYYIIKILFLKTWLIAMLLLHHILLSDLFLPADALSLACYICVLVC